MMVVYCETVKRAISHLFTTFLDTVRNCRTIQTCRASRGLLEKNDTDVFKLQYL